MVKPTQCPRLAAARCLTAVAGDGQSLNKQLAVFERPLPENQRSLYRELCYGSLRYYWQLDGALAPCFSKPLKQRDTDVKMLVIVGAYQLLHTRVPPHAAINSCVQACHSLKKKWAAGMVNAILRRCQREGEALFTALSPAAEAGLPVWLYDAIQSAWPAQAADIFSASKSHPPMCLRVNALQSRRSDYLQRLVEAGIDATECRFANRGLRLTQAVNVAQLPGFATGAISIQDEAAQLCADLLSLAPGQRVLDACAAPGGKTGAILEAEAGLADLVAIELEADRLQRVQENLQRLDQTANLVCADAAATDQWWDGQLFDRILLDAPCSATGVIRRNPDISLHRREADIEALCQLQDRLLDALWPTLKPGGRLLYATCSILPVENELRIAAFSSRQSDAQQLCITGDFGIDRSGGRQLFPQIGGHDGFFYALLQKS